jgi:glycosyltransferase involved in cell wall biosynthesis
MLHDAQVFTAPDSYPLPTRLWRKRILRQASRAGNHVLTVSAHSKANLLSLGLGKPRNIAVVPNGPGPAAHAIAAPLPRGISNARPFCLAFSSAQPHKNTAMLLRCFARPDMQDTTLVLVGMPVNGSVRSKNIVYTGRLSDQELAGLYAEASAVLIPSLQEGFGLPALEAMNHGTPVLVSDRGALPEVVEHAGLVLPAHDIEAWQIAIHRVSQAPRLRAELIAQGQRRAAELTWQNSANMVWQHLDRWFGTPRERG